MVQTELTSWGRFVTCQALAGQVANLPHAACYLTNNKHRIKNKTPLWTTEAKGVSICVSARTEESRQGLLLSTLIDNGGIPDHHWAL